jgi:hypothetical protein
MDRVLDRLYRAVVDQHDDVLIGLAETTLDRVALKRGMLVSASQ